MLYGLVRVLIGITQIIGIFGLQCYHMNLRGESKLINCRGFCTSIYAMVSGTNKAEVNYCVSERICLASLSEGELADRGNHICRALMENDDAGVISQCKAVVCQSDGCNDYMKYNYRSNPHLNDCNIYQCKEAECHNPELVQSTLTPHVTTGPLNTAASVTTESPGPLTHAKPERPEQFDTTTHFTITTTEISTEDNRVTTKDNTEPPEVVTVDEKTASSTGTPSFGTSTSPYPTPETDTMLEVSTEEPTMTSENAITTKIQTDEEPEEEAGSDEEEAGSGDVIEEEAGSGDVIEAGSGDVMEEEGSGDVMEEEGSGDVMEEEAGSGDVIEEEGSGDVIEEGSGDVMEEEGSDDEDRVTLDLETVGPTSEAPATTAPPTAVTTEAWGETTTEHKTLTDLPAIVTTEDKEGSTLVMEITRSPAGRKNFIGTTASSDNKKYIDNNGFFVDDEDYELEMAGRDTIQAEGNTSSAYNLNLSLSVFLALLPYVIL